GGFTVSARGAMGQAEAAVGWRDGDVLPFGRLGALAQAAGADRLVVGWISHLVVVTGATGTNTPPDDSGPPMADASLVLQVFDVARGRLVAQAQRLANEIGGGRAILAERAMMHALEHALLPIVGALSPP